MLTRLRFVSDLRDLAPDICESSKMATRVSVFLGSKVSRPFSSLLLSHLTNQKKMVVGNQTKKSTARDLGSLQPSKIHSYDIPPEYQRKFLPHEITKFQKAFSTFDADGNGVIDVGELQTVLRELKEDCSVSKTKTLIEQVDWNQNGTIEFTEFLQVLDDIRKGKNSSGFGQVVSKHDTIHKVEGKSGAVHSYSEEERVAFTEHINNCLRSDPHLQQVLPIDPESSTALFDAVKDGIVLSKLINQAVADTIDERALNIPRPSTSLNIYKQTENQNLSINAARSIGCTVVNVGAQDLIDGRPTLVLGLIWQIVKIQLLSTITLKNYPELMRLLQEDEEMADLLKLSPEDILLRWVNFHLANANSDKRVSNFTTDVADSEAYLVLLNQLDSSCCALDSIYLSNLKQRAANAIDAAKKLDVETFIQPNDIVQGNKKLNLAFVAQIFNTKHGLEITEEELYEMADMLDDDAGDTREERTFRMWINSLNLPNAYVNNLFLDVADGVIILKVMDKIEPGLVKWSRVNLSTTSRFKIVENCNYCIELSKHLQLSTVNIGGLDIVDVNKKIILALIWQLMRFHTLKILSSLSSSTQLISDTQIVQWANDRVQKAGRQSKMSNFRDRTLKSGVFLIDLCFAIEPRAVNWELVTSGENEEDQANNAKYAISIARKLGAVVFLTSDDIVEVKSKMIMTLVASLMATCTTTSKQSAEAAETQPNDQDTTPSE